MLINLLKKIEVIEKTNSEIENRQELIPSEIDPDNTKHENDNFKSQIGKPPNCSNFC